MKLLDYLDYDDQATLKRPIVTTQFKQRDPEDYQTQPIDIADMPTMHMEAVQVEQE